MSRRSRLKFALRLILWLPAVVLCLLTLMSAYGGMVDPRRCVLFAMAAMAFPLTAALLGLAMAVYAVLRRRMVTDVCALTLVACLPAYAIYSPYHPGGTDAQEERVFTVMNYNAYGYKPLLSSMEVPSPNPTVQCIINSGADIVCLQETVEAHYNLGRKGITQEQVDSLQSLYPYGKTFRDMSVYSKYPLEESRIVSFFTRKSDVELDSYILFYKVDFHGVPINVLAVYLSSVGLMDDDKELYETLAEGKVRHSGVRRGGMRLLEKFAEAARSRAMQADSLCAVADSIGGNVIICGDFNDIPGCYADRVLRRAGFTDAYAAAGNGAGISYRNNRFWFRIDHVFCRGNLRPLRSRVVREGISDHYPVVTSFAVGK